MSDQEFCRAVLDQIPRATAAEREDICRELMEHLEDHREALMEGGLDEAAAQERAVEAMGDAGEIGRQWNQRLSPLWLWVGRVCKVVCISLMIVMFLPGCTLLLQVSQNLSARWSATPGWDHSGENLWDDVWCERLDLHLPWNGQVIRFYEVALVEDAWRDSAGRTGPYQLELRVLAYAQNPLEPTMDRFTLWEITCTSGTSLGGGSSGNNGSVACDIRYPIQEGTSSVTFTLAGSDPLTVSVDIPWEEVDGYVP